MVNNNSGYLVLTKDDKTLYIIKENENVSLLLRDFYNLNNFEFIIDNNASLTLSIITNDQVENLKITVKQKNNSSFEAFFADFGCKKVDLEAVINLEEPNSNCIWHTASLATEQDNKNINVSIIHQSKETVGKVENYGVCRDDSKLLFSGVSHIVNGAIKSKTSQTAKIMVFDKNSDAIAKPILKIDENDVEANHAAAVGKINDEHLFYLTSRGISTEEAKTLITLGYLKPIFKGFDETNIAYLNQLIESRF